MIPSMRWLPLALLIGLAACPSPPPTQPVAAPDAAAKAPASQPAAVPARVELTHRASPGRAPEPGAPGWVREHPDVTAGLISALSPWGVGVAVGTLDGEVFSVSAENVWKRMGPRRNVGIVALASLEKSLFVLDADGALHRTEDGKNFAQVKQPPPGAPGDVRVPGVGRPWRAVAVASVDGQEVVVLAGRSRHVAVSRDGGKTWADDALDGPETFHSAYLEPDGTAVVTGERGRTFRRGPKDKAWAELHMKDKPTAMWIGRRDPKGPLVSADAGGAVRVFDGSAWSRAGNGPGPLRVLVPDAKGFLGACQSGGVVRVDVRKGAEARHTREWDEDGRPLHHIVSRNGDVWAAGPTLVLHREGRRWKVLRGERTQHLSGVVAVGSRRGFAVGEAGLALARAESAKGVSWEPMEGLGAVDADLTGITFASGRYGWIVDSGGRVGRTEDGGKMWSFATADSSVPSLASVAALDPLNVFASGGGSLLASSDRGKTWRKLTVPDGLPRGAISDLALERSERDARLIAARDGAQLLETAIGRSDVSATSLGFVTPSRVASADGTSWMLDLTGVILRRMPGEPAWRVMAVPAGLAFTNLAMDAVGNGVVLTSSGALFRSEDAGATWWLVTGGPERAPASVAAGQGGVFVVVGHGGEIQVSSDAGRSWSQTQARSGKSLTAVARTGEKLVAVGFRGAAFESADSGLTWVPWTGAPADVGTTHLTALQVEGGRVALGGIGAVWVREGGAAWTRLTIDGPSLGEVRRLRYGKAGGLVAVTATGALWKREGDTLKPAEIAPPPKAEVVRWSDVVSPEGRTLAVTGEGVVEVNLAGEPTWERAGLSQGLGAVPTGLYADGERAWLLGSGGMWANEGGSWEQVLPAFPTRPTDLHFTSSTVGYAVGGRGAVYGTLDGGVTWRTEGTPTKTTLNAVHVGADGRAVAVGAGGVVLRRVGQ
jgi:photosystem II stability/assembly factor-like uncharacterized protein